MADPDDVISRNLGQRMPSSAWNAARRGAPAGNPAEEKPEEYWTADRMAKARPVRLEGEAGSEDVLGAWVSKRLLKTDRGGHRTAAATFQTQPVPDPRQPPYRSIGKLFMTFGTEDAWGSAWLVGSRTVVTAGHCLYDHRRPNSWADRIVFVARYGSNQTGPKVAAARIHVLAGWHDHRDDMYAYDIAAATLASPLPEGDALGWAPDLDRSDEPFEAIGYPYAWLSPQHDFDGERMWRCKGGYVGGSNPVVMANNMTEGCSGGPWLVQRGGRFLVGGINSYRPPGQEGAVQSPRLGRGLSNLIAAA